MSRRNFQDGMEILFDDLNKITQAMERGLYERILWKLMGQPSADAFFDGGFLVTRASSSTLTVAAGLGIQYDSSQSSPESRRRPVYVSTNQVLTVATPDPTNNRIDSVCVAAALATELSESRNYKDPSTSAISLSTLVTQKDWAASLQVVVGTPAGSPAAPATPSGYIKIAEVVVTASTGIAASGAITDKRTRVMRPGSQKVVTKSANYSIDLDDDVILCSGSFNITLPPAASAWDSTNSVSRKFTVKNIGSGIITLVGTIDGNVNETLDASTEDSVTFYTDGTSWYYQ